MVRYTQLAAGRFDGFWRDYGAASNLDPGGLSLRVAVPATPTRDREPSRLKSDQRDPAARDADEPTH
jgi:hypothetical protein